MASRSACTLKSVSRSLFEWGWWKRVMVPSDWQAHLEKKPTPAPLLLWLLRNSKDPVSHGSMNAENLTAGKWADLGAGVLQQQANKGT